MKKPHSEPLKAKAKPSTRSREQQLQREMESRRELLQGREPPPEEEEPEPEEEEMPEEQEQPLPASATPFAQAANVPMISPSKFSLATILMQDEVPFAMNP